MPMASRTLTRVALLSLGVAILPLTAYAGAEPAAKDSDYYTKRTCKVTRTTGSRLGGVRRCRTQAEIDQARQEDRQVLERIQAFKSTCGDTGRCG
jgi:hypothetical protein